MKVKYKVVRIDRTSAFVGDSSKYCLKYNKGNIVKSVKGSLGVFCFKKRELCEDFIQQLKQRIFDNNHYQIIRVKPIQRGKSPKIICYNWTNLKVFYEHQYSQTRIVPIGTICYPEVLVLD